MKKVLILLVLGVLAWQYHFKQPDGPVITNLNSNGSLMSQPVVQHSSSFLSDAADKAKASAQQFTSRIQPASTASKYRCDGRTHCSQMRSCEEATYFLRNCPGAQMDGNNDGVPCERQWCR